MAEDKKGDLFRRYFYQSPDEAPIDARVSTLTQQNPSAKFLTPVIEVLDQFVNNDQLQIMPIIDHSDKPVGMVSRINLMETFNKPYTRELYSRRSVSDFMDTNPVIVERSTTIDDLARIVVYAGDQKLPDGFIVTHNNRYIGIGNFHNLLSEIIERKQAHLYRLAHYDALTGLPNRNLFLDRLQSAILDLNRPRSEQRKLAVLFIDLDRFKQVNDTLGHSGGDELLREVAERLTLSLRASDTVARLGGDEFIIMLTNIFQLQQVEHVIAKLFKKLREPFVIKGNSLEVTASIGAAMTDSHEETASELIHKADLTMYSAKAAGKNTQAFYQDNLTQAARERIQLEASLKSAIRSQRFDIHYQPIVHGQTQQLVSLEALLRWNDPELGAVSPSVFIPLAEEIGLIEDIGDWVIHQVCQQIITWQQAGLPEMVISINLSAREICNQKFAPRVRKLLEDTGVNPKALKMEVTESHILESPEVAIEVLSYIRDMGIQVSLDDFGTGYSSLSYIKRLPIDELKIDRSFVKDMVDDQQDQAIVEAAITLARRLGITTVAEGVETSEQVAVLTAQGCDALQGYFFSRPVPADAVPELLNHLSAAAEPA